MYFEIILSHAIFGVKACVSTSMQTLTHTYPRTGARSHTHTLTHIRNQFVILEMNFRREMVSEEMPGKMALSPNTVRIAKVFSQWACNIWWARELTMQHERFVMILQV